MIDQAELECAKRDAFTKAVARHIHEDLRYQFSILEDGMVYSHCLAAATVLIDGLVAVTSTKSTGAFDSDIGFRYGMNMK